ncbi:MAG: flagellin [Chloroflexi bacterium]|nr:flagellin [Chloroflexota bacterium]
MALRINYNQASSQAQRGVSGAQNSFFSAISQLSSGLRINKAADDSAGLAVSEKLKNQVRGLNQAQRNAQDAISLLQTAEGALNEVHSILGRMRELAVQSANDTLTNSDRAHIQNEVNSLLSEVDRIGNSTQFNSIQLLNGDASGPLNLAGFTFHVGANTDVPFSNEIAFTIGNSSLGYLGGTDGVINSSTLASVNALAATGVATQTDANAAIATIDTAVEAVSGYRGAIGAMQNRLESAINSIGVAAENTGAANSRIRDADVAQSVSEMIRSQILQQSSMAVLAQANQAPQSVLQLLK